MKEIINDLWDLDDKLNDSWYILIPSYLNLWYRDLFDIDLDIFHEIEYIIGKRKK